MDRVIDVEEDEGIADLENVSTASLRSSLVQPVYSHGRQYQGFKEGEYHRPNDDEELDRLDLMSQVFDLINHGQLHRAPIGDSAQRILDIGFGTGSWAIPMGDKYPQAEIVGIDISASAPSWIPPNVRFEIADVEDELIFGASFDYIHCRYMAGAIKDWPQLVHRSFENLAPGGWAEFADVDVDYYSQDGTLTPDHAIIRWVKIAVQGMEDFGRTLRPGKRLEGWMSDAGFINLEVVRDQVPVGRWPKDKRLKQIGLLNFVQLHEGLTGLNVRLFCDFLGWRREDLDVLLMEVRADFRNPAIHSMYDMYTVWGQRPLEASSGSREATTL